MISPGRDIFEKKIENSLCFMERKLKCENRSGKQAYNKTAETIMCGLLNMMYGYVFENVNTEGKPNFPGIDLYDRKHRVGVQVTTQNTVAKVDQTLKRVMDNEECSSISRLIILVLTLDDPTPAMKKRKVDRWFKGEEDIWTLHKIKTELFSERTDTLKLKAIAEYLEKEIGGEEDLTAAPSVTEKSEEPAEKEQEPVPDPVPKEKIRIAAVLIALILVFAVGACMLLREPVYEVSSPESGELLLWKPVEEILCSGQLTETAVPLSSYDSRLNRGGNVHSTKGLSVSYPFAVQSAQLPFNPVSAFNALRNDYFVPRTESFIVKVEEPYIWEDYLNRMPYDPTTEWEWSESGVKAFLCDVLAMASKCDDNFDLDDRFLSAIHSSQEDVVHFSAADHCYYVYFIYYGDNSSHVVSMYFHANEADKTRISDVEIQFLNSRYCIYGGAGGTYSIKNMANCNKAQALAMIMSVEHLLTGSCGVDTIDSLDYLVDDELVVSPEYGLGDYRVSMMMQGYRSTAVYDVHDSEYREACDLLTYRISRSEPRS